MSSNNAHETNSHCDKSKELLPAKIEVSNEDIHFYVMDIKR